MMLLLLLIKQTEEYFYKNLKGALDNIKLRSGTERETTQFKTVVSVLNQAKFMCPNINISKPPERFISLNGIFSSGHYFVLPVTIPLQVPYKISPYFYFTPTKIHCIKVHRRRGIPYHLIEVIKILHRNTSVQIETGRKILDKIYITQGVRQGCNLSPALFIIYIDDLLRNWKHSVDAGIMLKRNFYLNTLLFADDQIIIQDSEDKLQKSVYILNQMNKDYYLTISTKKLGLLKENT
jgi:hypothetical protein